MMDPNLDSRKWPRLPVFGWEAFAGAKRTELPCILDAPHIAFTSSGKAAIALALSNLGIGSGSRVLVPTYHCPTMIAPVVASGALPVFFPVDSAGSPRLDIIAGLDLSGVRAMIAAHYFGFARSMARLRQFCDERRIALIEDCAHAMFGRSEDGPIGMAGDYAIASLTKFFPVSDGGCLVSWSRPIAAQSLRSRSIADQLKCAANAIEIGVSHQALPGLHRVLGAGFAAARAMRGRGRGPIAPHASSAETDKGAVPGAITPAMRGRASVWSQWVSTAAARARIVALRRRNYLRMTELLSDVPGTRVLFPLLPESVVPYVFPLWVAAPDKSYQQVRAAGIPLFRWDDVWPGVPAIPGDIGPDWSIRVFQLACHQDLRLADLDVIADSFKRVVNGAAS